MDTKGARPSENVDDRRTNATYFRPLGWSEDAAGELQYDVDATLGPRYDDKKLQYSNPEQDFKSEGGPTEQLPLRRANRTLEHMPAPIAGSSPSPSPSSDKPLTPYDALIDAIDSIPSAEGLSAIGMLKDTLKSVVTMGAAARNQADVNVRDLLAVQGIGAGQVMSMPAGAIGVFSGRLPQLSSTITRGVRGHVLHEIDDSGMVWKKGLTAEPQRLDEVIDHPELFKLYPELRNVKIVHDPNLSSTASFSGSEDTALISLSGRDLSDVKDVYRSIVHEVQHAVQGQDIIDGVIPPTGRRILRSPGTSTKDAGLQAKTYMSKLKRWVEEEGAISLDERAQELFTSLMDMSDHLIYRLNPGEMEARHAEARLGMSARERAQRPAVLGVDPEIPGVPALDLEAAQWDINSKIMTQGDEPITFGQRNPRTANSEAADPFDRRGKPYKRAGDPPPMDPPTPEMQARLDAYIAEVEAPRIPPRQMTEDEALYVSQVQRQAGAKAVKYPDPRNLGEGFEGLVYGKDYF